jgi:hypothetical protein
LAAAVRRARLKAGRPDREQEIMEPELVAPTMEAIRRWAGIDTPNEAARLGLADFEALIAEVEAVRAAMEFEDEPSGFEAALSELKEKAR